MALTAKTKATQVFKCLQVNILGNVFPVFRLWDHLKNNLRDQAFRVLNNQPEYFLIATKYFVNQLFV